MGRSAILWAPRNQGRAFFLDQKDRIDHPRRVVQGHAPIERKIAHSLRPAHPTHSERFRTYRSSATDKMRHMGYHPSNFSGKLETRSRLWWLWQLFLLVTPSKCDEAGPRYHGLD